MKELRVLPLMDWIFNADHLNMCTMSCYSVEIAELFWIFLFLFKFFIA